jgi:hypothetical protein
MERPPRGQWSGLSSDDDVAKLEGYTDYLADDAFLGMPLPSGATQKL